MGVVSKPLPPRTSPLGLPTAYAGLQEGTDATLNVPSRSLQALGGFRYAQYPQMLAHIFISFMKRR